MLVDRAEPTEGTNQLTRHSRERRSPPQTVRPQTHAGGPGKAHSRYQPANPPNSKQKLKSQLGTTQRPNSSNTKTTASLAKALERM